MNEEKLINRCKLIVVEGIPGSGKTSTARIIQGLLDEARVPNTVAWRSSAGRPLLDWLPGTRKRMCLNAA